MVDWLRQDSHLNANDMIVPKNDSISSVAGLLMPQGNLIEETTIVKKEIQAV